jgi:lipoyl(octanoyl) transferase
VNTLETSIIKLLADYTIIGHRQDKAPGVYVESKKICFIGLRVRRGFTYHGLAFNIDMDLSPFSRINPCGYPNLGVTQLKDLVKITDIKLIKDKLVDHICTEFGYPEYFINSRNEKLKGQ